VHVLLVIGPIAYLYRDNSECGLITFVHVGYPAVAISSVRPVNLYRLIKAELGLMA